MRTVLFLSFPWMQTLDLVGPLEVFATASLVLAAKGSAGYQPLICSVDGQPVTTSSGLTLATTPLRVPAEPADTVLLPGGAGVHDARADSRVIDWTRAVAVDARRVVSVCTGAFLAAQTVARWLVLHLRRPGGQTQFAAPVWVGRAKREPIRAVQEAVESEPGGAHSIAELARLAAMSPRHFTRVFTHEVGEAPGAYVERVRTEAARRQLEQTDDTVTTIATRCGFGSAETMRRNFVRRVGVSPEQYRKAFA